MQYTQLGRAGLRVSRLCLGTMNFGSGTSKEESFKIMDAALDAGINFFDTANNYGFLTGDLGITETIMGEWFAQGGGRRRRVVLSTKVHEDMGDTDDGPNTKPGLSIYKIRRHFEQSLKRLQTDHIEIYYMHHIDRNVQPEEAMSAFENLYDRGLIDYIGTSNFPAWQIARYLNYSESKKSLGIVVEQDRYNLMARLPELELLPACGTLGVGFVAWGPLNGGLLAAPSKDSNRRPKEVSPEVKKQLDDFAKLCDDAGIVQQDMALAWMLADERVTAPIIGVRTLEHFNQTLKVLDVNLTEDIMKRLDEIFPGHGGEAPEAYAW